MGKLCRPTHAGRSLQFLHLISSKLNCSGSFSYVMQQLIQTQELIFIRGPLLLCGNTQQAEHTGPTASSYFNLRKLFDNF